MASTTYQTTVEYPFFYSRLVFVSLCDWGLTRLARIRRRPHAAAAKVSTLTLQNVGECYNGYVQSIRRGKLLVISVNIRISLIKSRTNNSF